MFLDTLPLRPVSMPTCLTEHTQGKYIVIFIEIQYNKLTAWNDINILMINIDYRLSIVAYVQNLK